MLFATVDISNAFHSCWLPPPYDTMFVVAVVNESGISKHYWRTLPFGWDKSPAVFENLMLHFLEQYLQDHICILVYLDDILLASRDTQLLASTTLKLRDKLVEEGFLMSMKKCVLEPSLQIDWLGKHLSSFETGVVISVSVDDILDAACLAVWCCSKYWSWPVLTTVDTCLL